MTTFVLAPAGAGAFDLAWSGLRAFTLWRRDGAVGLEVPPDDAPAIRRALALHGVGAAERALARDVPGGLVRAIGTGLRPVRLASGELDVLAVRVLPLAAATALALARPHPRWPLGSARRARARTLLRGTDLVFAVERQAWCGRATLAAARQTLRPLLFDRGAAPRGLHVRASDGALAAWVRG